MTDTPPPISPEVLDWITEQSKRTARQAAREAAREAVRRYRRASLIGFLLLALGLGYALHETHRANVATLHAGLVSSCDRVNILRAQSNLSNSVSFNILSASLQRESVLAKSNADGHAKAHQQTVDVFAKEARKLKITKLSVCPLAVDHPQTYRFPLAGPIGDPLTGKYNVGVAAILRDSQHLVTLHTAPSVR